MSKIPDNKMILEMFKDLPLTVQMRAAADVLEDTSLRNEGDVNSAVWSAKHLRQTADTWEQKDAADAEKEQAVEELSQALYATLHSNGFDYYNTAKALIDNGWGRVRDD